MGDYARPKNPQSIPSTKVRVFDGIGGPVTQILKRFNSRGWDISSTVANEVSDLHLAEKGSLLLRPGMRRLGSEDHTIGWLGQINIGGLLKYGVIYNNSLSVVDLPSRLGYDLIPWPEDDPVKPTDWPAGWHFYPWEPVDDVIPEDPSLPLEEQVCTVGYTWSNEPAEKAFEMQYAGTLPSSVNWYHKTEGYRPYVQLIGNYNAPPAWLYVNLLTSKTIVLNPCLGQITGGILFTPNGKDIDDEWLVPATYNFTSTLTWSDGEVMTFPITLYVYGPAITLSPEEWDEPSVVVGDSGNKTKTINISNTGDAGSSLVWEYVLTGDAVLTAILTADKASGTLAKSADEDVVFTMTDPGGLAAGSYSATITFRDSRLNTVTGTVDVTLVVVPVFTGNILWSGTFTIDGVLQSSPTLVGVYCAPFNDGFEPGWHRASGYLWGLTPHTGFHVAHDGWEIFFQDVAWWEWGGGTSQAYQDITSFNANGCPTGTYTWITPYKAISHEQVDVYTITISEIP